VVHHVASGFDQTLHAFDKSAGKLGALDTCAGKGISSVQASGPSRDRKDMKAFVSSARERSRPVR
jgi:hypothetical protein